MKSHVFCDLLKIPLRTSRVVSRNTEPWYSIYSLFTLKSFYIQYHYRFVYLNKPDTNILKTPCLSLLYVLKLFDLGTGLDRSNFLYLHFKVQLLISSGRNRHQSERHQSKVTPVSVRFLQFTFKSLSSLSTKFNT